MATTEWFARPVLYVKSVEAALHFYVDQLGFKGSGRYDEGGKVTVAQVERQGCSLLLTDHRPEKVGKGLVFISFNADPEMQITAWDALRAELEARAVPVRDGWWGYRLLVVEDPDGNQLFFNYPNPS